MNKAKKLEELYNVLKPEALDYDNMLDFYCDKTMPIRTGDLWASPILDISEELIRGDCYKSILFMGHRGCGKSTELKKLKQDLEKKEFKVGIIETTNEIDIQNIVYSDLLILVSKKIINIANELNCYIEEDVLKELENFWDEKEIEEIKNYMLEKKAIIGVDSSASGEGKSVSGIPNLAEKTILVVAQLFGKATAEIKRGDEKKETIRSKVQKRASDWIEIIKVVSNVIRSKLNGKIPIIIFEELDRLNPTRALEIFKNHSDSLSSIPVNIIYTFPISLSYSPEFGSVSPYFNTQRLPMIKLHTIDNSPFVAGIKIMKEIIFKRANEILFKEDALEKAIVLTGGSLRDLFKILSNAGSRASRRGSDVIEVEDVLYHLKVLESELAIRIDGTDYDFLKEIYKGSKEKIEDKEKLLKMMQAQVVMEYNGTRWRDLHPLIARFLKEKNLV